MKKIILFTTLTILFIVFLLPAFLASLINMIPANDQPGYDGSPRASIYKGREFIQYFTSPEKNLTAVGTTIKNPNLKNKKEIVFNLYDDGNNLIRTVKINGQNIEDGDFVKLIFEKIGDSKGKKYYFTLSSETAGQEEIIEVFLIKPTENILNYIYDEENKPGGVPLVTFHKPQSVLETIKLVYINWLSKLLPQNSQKF